MKCLKVRNLENRSISLKNYNSYAEFEADMKNPELIISEWHATDRLTPPIPKYPAPPKPPAINREMLPIRKLKEKGTPFQEYWKLHRDYFSDRIVDWMDLSDKGLLPHGLSQASNDDKQEFFISLPYAVDINLKTLGEEKPKIRTMAKDFYVNAAWWHRKMLNDTGKRFSYIYA